jgi:hypothetical protein
MKNIIATRIPGIIKEAMVAIPAVTREAARLGLSHVKPATMELHLSNLQDAIRATDLAHVAFSNARRTRKNLYLTGRKHVGTARDVLRFFLGNEPSESWTHAGYEGSLAMPRAIEPLVANLQRLARYLKAHADHEFAKLNVTSAITQKLADDLVAAHAAVALAKVNLGAAIKDRDAKAQLVRLDIRMLLAELKIVLDPKASLWEGFGFKRPGLVQAPEAPEEITVELFGSTGAIVRLEKPARARRIRVYQKVEGVDQDFVVVQSRRDVPFALHELPANSEIHFAFSASNRGGESARSKVFTVKTKEKQEAPGTQIQAPEKIQTSSSNPEATNSRTPPAA